MTVDDFDADAGVGIPARGKDRDSDDKKRPTKRDQRTCRVAPTTVVRPESSATLKTRL